MYSPRVSSILTKVLAAGVLSISASPIFAFAGQDRYFHRIAVFPICQQLEADCDVNDSTSAEIVAASVSGHTLIYTNSPNESVGFVNIWNPEFPEGLGEVGVGGEPTSVAVKGPYALVGVNTSSDFVNTSGKLVVIKISTRQIVAEIPLSGQPDSVAVSPDKRYAAIAIENERDDDLGDGTPPQLPAGTLDIVDLTGTPGKWSVRSANMTGLADLYGSDPEPEYVDINSNNVAVVTMQENNHIVLVDLKSGDVVDHFSAGSVDLVNIDTTEEGPALISLTESQNDVLREPDGVTWLNRENFATANEGDLDGGSRGFSVFNWTGDVLFDSGNALDHMAVRLGHYPDDRSGNKGNEPENVEKGRFFRGGAKDLLFVASERSSLVFVYDIADESAPRFIQALPAGVGPEGVLAMPTRHLLIAASEEDDRGDKIRSVLNIYRYGYDKPDYPTVMSADRPDGTPIPWAALSGLVVDPTDDNTLYAVHDSFYQQARIYRMDISSLPAVIAEEIVLKDGGATVNIDSEGIAVGVNGGFWVASEGSGNAPGASTLNRIFKVAANGDIEQVINLPGDVNAIQSSNGFEGIAAVEEAGVEVLYVAFQRAWQGEDSGWVRIGRYDTDAATWSFAFYPLDAVTSPNGGWIGLSELTHLGGTKLAVIERDNQGGPDARIKRIYKFDTSVTAFAETPDTGANAISKVLVDDLMNDLQAPAGLVPEKIEGMAKLTNGDILIVNDNDGVDGSNGETQLIKIQQ